MLHEEALKLADEAYADVQAGPGIEYLASEQQHIRGLAAAISAYIAALPQQEPLGYVTGSNLRAMKDGLQGVMTVSNVQNALFQNPIFASPISSPEVERLTNELRAIKKLREDWRSRFFDADDKAKRYAEQIIDLTAELEAAESKLSLDSGEVRVKPLGWITIGEISFANTPFGSYEARWSLESTHTGFQHALVMPREKDEKHFFASVDEAKAFAESDFETRIRSALVSSPTAGNAELIRELVGALKDSSFMLSRLKRISRVVDSEGLAPDGRVISLTVVEDQSSAAIARAEAEGFGGEA